MPIFGRGSFKASRKVPKRRADAGSTNPTQLTDKEALDPNLDFSATPLRLSLGGQSMVFQQGNWIANEVSHNGSQVSLRGSEEASNLKEKIIVLEEESNMLKYKIEILLDMLAVSNADMNCMERELESLRRAVGTAS